MTILKKYPITLIAISAEASPDSSDVLLKISTQYAGALTYALPQNLIDDLIADLERLRPTAPPVAAMTKERSGAASSSASPSPNADRVVVRTPKRWMLGNGLPGRPTVVLVVDPQTDHQAGYAFDVKAARDMAAALVKNADAVAAHAEQKTSN